MRRNEVDFRRRVYFFRNEVAANVRWSLSMTESDLYSRVYEWLEPILLHPRRFTFVFSNPEEFQISTLRGVWGRALKAIDEDVYSKIFEGRGSKQLTTPRYVLRRAGLSQESDDRRIEVDFITWGASEEDLDVMTRAWNIATQFGFGRGRERFVLENSEPLYLPAPPQGLSLAKITKALSTVGEPYAARFETPVRFLERGVLIEEPTFEELIKRTIARLATIRLQTTKTFNLADSGRPAELRPDFYAEIFELAKTFRASKWRGEKCAYRRYSGRQRMEVEMRGIVGGWELYEDLGDLRSLVDSATVLGVGKATVLGLGRLALDYD